MQRPEFISDEDIARWSKNIDQDLYISPELAASPIIREVCYAGLWLCEKLEKLGCPEILITRIQWTAGKISFGRDIWEVHQEILREYETNSLSFEEDFNEIKN